MSILCSKRRSMYSMKSACQYLAIHPTTYRGWGNSCYFMLNYTHLIMPAQIIINEIKELLRYTYHYIFTEEGLVNRHGTDERSRSFSSR